MAKALHAADYLSSSKRPSAAPFCVLFGEESFLKRQVILALRSEVLGEEEGDFSFTNIEGRQAVLSDVLDDLATVAMFGGGRRLVVIRDADDFVSRYRAELEDYAARPSPRGVLVLEVRTFAANTRLYKQVAESGLALDCSAPSGPKLLSWAVGWAKQVHQVQLSQSAADELIESVGPELGLLDQELAKLALAAGEGRKVGPELVRQMVGGWRARSTWDMLDAALAGRAADALKQLDRLLASGEQPIALLGQISASLRRLAAATRLILEAERSGKRIGLRPALEQAGVKPFVLGKAETQLKRLGRHRGAQLYEWLLEADLDLKGASQLPPRLVLEQLVVRLAAEPAPRA
ncbi:MAG: DNA polymerase III subunit delta [Planctomycetota bacterium]